MKVERVMTEGGDHIEPPLDPNWTELRKLEWLAAVVAVDTGFVVTVRQAPSHRWRYCLSGPGWGLSDMAFAQCWDYLSGISIGARRHA